MNEPNKDLRLYAKSKDVPLWKLAKHIGVSEPTISRMFRCEFDEEKTKELKIAIDEISTNESR